MDNIISFGCSIRNNINSYIVKTILIVHHRSVTVKEQKDRESSKLRIVQSVILGTCVQQKAFMTFVKANSPSQIT